MGASSLIVAENKQLVLDDRAADGPAELAPESGRNVPTGDGVRVGLGKWVAREGRVRATVKETAAMPRVRP